MTNSEIKLLTSLTQRWVTVKQERFCHTEVLHVSSQNLSHICLYYALISIFIVLHMAGWSIVYIQFLYFCFLFIWYVRVCFTE